MKLKKKKLSTKRKSVKKKFDTVNVNLNSHASLDNTEQQRMENTQTQFRPSNASSPIKTSSKKTKIKLQSSQHKMSETTRNESETTKSKSKPNAQSNLVELS